VTASVLAVAAGALFALWNIAHNPILEPIGALVPGLQALGHGVWLLGGLLVALVVRKPGAALYGEIVAATVSALIGNEWGVITLVYGVVQGLGAELVFALLLYRSWGFVAAILAGAGAGVAMAILDIVLWYAGAGPTYIAIYAVSSVVSGVAIAGIGGFALARALRSSGALGRR
jgi:energy-coupling factor transport system substrate-specific component